MSKPLQVGDTASLESLDAAYKASHERHDRERLLAIHLAHQGSQTLEQIGVILKRGRATIARWVKAYREGGIQKLLQRGWPQGQLIPVGSGSNDRGTVFRTLEESQRYPGVAAGRTRYRPEAGWSILLAIQAQEQLESSPSQTQGPRPR